MSAQAIIDVDHAAGYILDLFVAMALGAELHEEDGRFLVRRKMEGQADTWALYPPTYSIDPAHTGMLIEQEKIDVEWEPNGKPVAQARTWVDFVEYKAYGPTSFVAVHRCFVKTRLGSTITIPASLLDGYIEGTKRRQEVRASLDKFAEQSAALVGIDAPRSVQPSDHVDVHATADAARARVSALGKQLT